MLQCDSVIDRVRGLLVVNEDYCCQPITAPASSAKLAVVTYKRTVFSRFGSIIFTGSAQRVFTLAFAPLACIKVGDFACRRVALDVMNSSWP